MKAAAIAEGIYRLGVNLDSNHLFEGMWPIPNGISINSYVVQGEKTALIDLVEDINNKPVEFVQGLGSIPLAPRDIDYLVVNHMEPDHTGWLPEFVRQNPHLKIYITEKGAAILKAFCGIEENVQVVKTGDTLALGGNKELIFYEIPNLHWPETMATFERNSGILFSCDAFGSYGWSGGAQKELDTLTEKMQWTFADPVEWRGAPSQKVINQAASQAKKLAQSLKE